MKQLLGSYWIKKTVQCFKIYRQSNDSSGTEKPYDNKCIFSAFRKL